MLVHVTCTKDFKRSENLINPYFPLSFIFHSLKPKKYTELPISACHSCLYTAPVILDYRTAIPYNQKLPKLSQLLTAAGSQRKKIYWRKFFHCSIPYCTFITFGFFNPKFGSPTTVDLKTWLDNLQLYLLYWFTKQSCTGREIGFYESFPSLIFLILWFSNGWWCS